MTTEQSFDDKLARSLNGEEIVEQIMDVTDPNKFKLATMTFMNGNVALLVSILDLNTEVKELELKLTGKEKIFALFDSFFVGKH